MAQSYNCNPYRGMTQQFHLVLAKPVALVARTP